MFEKTLTEPVMLGFFDELSKESGAVGNAMQAGLGSGLGIGLGTGAALGGLRGGVRSFRQSRESGEGLLSSTGHALTGALGGAVRGGAAGAAIGAGLGAVSGRLSPKGTELLTTDIAKSKGRVGAFSRFGQRQVHSLTGWKPGSTNASIESIGAGAADARAALKGAKTPGEVARAKATLEGAERAQKMGLTSLPGIAKSVKNEGLIPTAKAGLSAGWQGASPKMKALMVGMPALSVARTLREPPREEGGPGKGERIGRLVGSTVGTMGAPLSLAGSLVLSGALEHAGGALGKGVDKLRGKKQSVVQPSFVSKEPSRPPASEPGDTGQVATERVFGTGYGNNGGLE